MTQEEKDLLLKDLCARLPYGVKAVLTRTNCRDSVNKVSEKDIYSFRTGRPLEEDHGQHDYYRVVVTDIKPYLFPLSSMTEEQRQEYTYIVNYISPDDTDNWKEGEFIYVEQFTQLMHFYHKNHLDYRGLITMGLATDATGLNIY